MGWSSGWFRQECKTDQSLAEQFIALGVPDCIVGFMSKYAFWQSCLKALRPCSRGGPLFPVLGEGLLSKDN